MKELRRQEGIKITVELIQQALEIPGIKGVHIQAIEWETANGTDRQSSRAVSEAYV